MARSLAPARLSVTMTTERKHALVVGGLGVIGRNLVEHLDGLDDWEVTAVSRRCPEFETSARFVSTDLLDGSATEQALRGLTGVTHLFYAAYQARLTRHEEVEPNLTMLRNVVKVVERASPSLRHVTLMQGGKAYGCHLGPFRTPAKESDPRHMPPNFYYDQEDFLREREREAGWTWTALRPEAVCGFAVGNPMNLAMVIAVYASISNALGLPLRFPGKPGAYDSLYQVTDAGLLARATVWAAEEPGCRNEVLNITNGDYFRWKNLWSVFADFFGMSLAEPQTVSLVETMSDKTHVWDEIVSRHGLRPYPYADVAHWGFGDVVFGITWDNISSTLKARGLGFQEFVDTEEMFVTLFERFRRGKIIP